MNQPQDLAQPAQKRISLNSEQEQAVEHVTGPCFVCACPGSGKTRVIVERTIRLIEKGASPRSILCITFTNKAANEMKERIVKKLGDTANEIYISTFHSLCATIIRKFGAYIGYGVNTTILDDDDQEGLMSQSSRQAGLELTSPYIKSLIWKANDLREKLIPESEFKDNFKDEKEANIVLDYLARMRKNNQIDFSGLLSETVRLLEKDAEILCKLQTRFDYIQVDEAQDTNLAQFRLVQLLGAHNNVFVVGDPDQSVYGWRGARYQNIEDFIKINKAKVVSLPQNYRSTPEIVKIASNLIKKNPNRQQQMEFKTSNPSGKPVECLCLPNPEQEASYIANRIREMIVKKECKPHEIAILYRINSMSRSLEQGLMNAGIPYQVIGGFSFFDRSEVKDCMAMLRFSINPMDGMALSRFINKPTRKIGEVTLGKIENFANDNGINLIEALKRAEEYISGRDKAAIIKGCKEIVDAFDFERSNRSIGETLAELLARMSYSKYLDSHYEGKDLDDRKDNVQELVNACALYSEKRGNDIAAYLSNIALQSSSDKESKENSVSLMSLHASKGLEFPVVFMPCMEEGQFPHKRAIVERDGLDEERRLCYVGMTRAERQLILTFPAHRMMRYKNGGVKFERTTCSRFLAESGASVGAQLIGARQS